MPRPSAVHPGPYDGPRRLGTAPRPPGPGSHRHKHRLPRQNQNRKPALRTHLIAHLALALLAACGPVPGTEVNPSALKAVISTPATVRNFSPIPTEASQRSNDQIAADFLDLEFSMESGRVLPLFSRFEGPIHLRLTGAVPQTAAAEMTHLMHRLRSEAGIDLRPATDGQTAAITVEFTTKAALQRLEPSAACFVAPNVASLREYRALRFTQALDWQGLATRRIAAIFVPGDTSPQEIRDCLHEETAQALGPLNDLYRLPDSVFNDDNFQTVLTGSDMLMLRLHYAPELASGMTRSQVTARLPAILARLNPGGQYLDGQNPGDQNPGDQNPDGQYPGDQNPGGGPSPDTPRAWLQAVNTALGPGTAKAARLHAAGRMLQMAQAAGWTDNRLGFSWFVLGRTQAPDDPVAAELSFTAAARIYAGLPDDGVHLSHALMQLSALALATGRPETAMALCDQAMPLARRGQNAALLASLQLIKAASLDLLGRAPEAAALRLDSLPAARYGFGGERAVRDRAAEITALARRG